MTMLGGKKKSMILVSWTLASYLFALYLYTSSITSFKPPYAKPFQNVAHREIINQTTDDPTSQKLFTFIQISDLHISRFNGHGGLAHVSSFLRRELPLIGPDLLFVTGDLVDAKSKSKLYSEQYMDEWSK